MPTYIYRCFACKQDTEVWESIHSETRTHGDCGHPITRVIGNVRTLGIGRRASDAIVADATEARWSKDLPAYKRLRHDGLQPPGIDGSAHLEATATSEIYVNSGGRMKYSDELVRESKLYAEEIVKGAL